MDGEDLRLAFLDACALASTVLAHRAVAEAWEEASALEGLSVGGVAAHLYGATRRFEIALDEQVPAGATVVGVAEFYGRNRVEDPAELAEGLHALLRDDAERRAADGPGAFTRRFDALVERLGARLPAEPLDRLVPVWTIDGAAAPLADYLATRVVELVVHTDDLAASAGLSAVVVPERAATVAVDAFVRMARHRAGDLEVIRAFARAERAAPGALRVL